VLSLCFVCLGNICRSPTAEGVMRALAEREAMSHLFHLDSAGTAAYHSGELADPRTRAAARLRGIELTHRARQVSADDYHRFDYLLAMDGANLAHLRARAPAGARAQLALFRSFDPLSEPDAEVPDPYYGGPSGFEEVLDLCERAAEGLWQHLRRESLQRHPIR
jgi:protein-tyrosine phosphatase